MNTPNMSTQKKRGALLKLLSVVGFLAVIGIITWLSIQLISTAPKAFSSLASLAESMQSTTQETVAPSEEVTELTVNSNVIFAKAGDPITLSWNQVDRPGTFTFSHACTDGIAVDLISEAEVHSIDCEKIYNLGDVSRLTIIIDSEKERYADLSYTISFLGVDDTAPSASDTENIAVINYSVTDTADPTDQPHTASTTPALTESEPQDLSPVTPEPEPEPEIVVTPEPPQPTITEPEFIYAIPESDPAGHVDLATRFLDAGTLTEGTFNSGPITQSDTGALQLEVRNLGTKTSETWGLTITLPSGGIFTLDDQEPLKPSERAVIIIGFPVPEMDNFSFTNTVKTAGDLNMINNTFTQPLTFVE